MFSLVNNIFYIYRCNRNLTSWLDSPIGNKSNWNGIAEVTVTPKTIYTQSVNNSYIFFICFVGITSRFTSLLAFPLDFTEFSFLPVKLFFCVNDNSKSKLCLSDFDDGGMMKVVEGVEGVEG